MKNILLLIFIFLSISCKKDNVQPKGNTSLEPISSGEIIKHTYYSLAYSEADEQAYWVYYHLTPELINGTQTRTDDFRPDPLVSKGSAALADYSGSGYDRGHLCPAADMTLNHTSMSETFYLSNMSPQTHGFNAGVWSRLETKVRDWAIQYDGLYVVAGGVLSDKIGTIGINEVTIPKKFYKVIYDEKNGMIAFIIPNESSSLTLDSFAVSVDEVERQTGIDFFSGLDDKIENLLESEIQTDKWDFK